MKKNPFTDATMSTRTLNELNKTSVQDLIDSKVCALIVPGFIEPELAQKISSWTLSHQEQVKYNHELYVDGVPREFYFGVNRVGTPYNSTYGHPPDHPSFRDYYRAAGPLMEEIRGVCRPFSSPMETLIRKLGAVWTDGAQIASFDGHPMFAGILRNTLAGESGVEIPHCDSLPPGFNLTAQLSANIYCSVPERGGELQVWDVPPLSVSQITELRPDQDFREKLGAPIEIKPKVGDLILINTRRLHGIRSFEKGSRVSMQSFIGYIPGKPLFFWS